MNQVYSPKLIGMEITKTCGVLKASEVARLSKANSIVAAAERFKQKIKVNAENDYERERERGYRDGREIAEKEAAARFLSEQMWFDRKISEFECELASIVKTSVRKVLGSFDDVHLIEAMVAVAMKRLQRHSTLKIHLPINLIAEFLPVAQKLESSFPNLGSVELIPDASLQSPDFILESPLGRLECRMADNLAELDALIDSAVGPHADEVQICKAEEEVA